MKQEVKDKLIEVAQIVGKDLYDRQRATNDYKNDGVIGTHTKKTYENDILFTPEQIKEGLR